jgi:hypothetical protein
MINAMTKKEIIETIVFVCVIINVIAFIFGFGFPGADLE